MPKYIDKDMKNIKKYHIITYGCQMNKSDSQRIATILSENGFIETKNLKNANIVVILACSVRQTAIDRIWGVLRNINNDVTKILTGCVLSTDKKSFEKKFDLIFDIKKIHEFESFLKKKQFEKYDYFDIVPTYQSAVSAYVPIMTGCNNFCSYCAVPYVRGRETSRSLKDVLMEITALIKKGYLQITLLGQNVNSYQPDDFDNFSKENPFSHNFAKLLWEINSLKGNFRINFASAHPKDMSDDVISALALPKMINFIHLALQSGDDRILEKMNRKYTTEKYENIINKIRQINPQIAIGTDIIVGFPSESEADFQRTLDFYKKINFDISYNAMFSPRQQTMAASFDDDVLHEDKKKRWHLLQKLMEKTVYEINQKYVGQEVEVLVEKFKDNVCEGDSREMKRVQFRGTKECLNKLVKIKINQAKEWMLYGEESKSIKAKNIKAKNIKAKSIKAKSIKAKSIKAKNIKAKSMIAKNIKAKSIKAKSIKAKSIKAKSIKTKSIKAKNMIAKSIKAKSIKAKSIKAKSNKAKSIKAKNIKVKSIKAKNIKAKSMRTENWLVQRRDKVQCSKYNSKTINVRLSLSKPLKVSQYKKEFSPQ